MNKIAILYYSGVGITKTIASYMYNYLKNKTVIDIYSIDELPVDFSFDNYSKLIIGFPTIHTEPALPIKRFVQQLDKNKEELPTFVYTTCGLYSGNTVRIFCKIIIKKNLIPTHTRSYRCPATDGSLLTPNIKRWHSYEKGLSLKIKQDLDNFLGTPEVCSKIPKLKWYSALNYPNKFVGQHMHFKIYLHENKCVKCGECIKKCPAGACVESSNQLPIIDNKKCINCYRCIHHCPQLALSLSKRKTPPKTLVKSRL